MNWGAVVIWGFAATVVLSIMISGSRGLGLTRMDMGYLLGTMFTGDRDKAAWIGLLVHMINGWIFALIYAALFYASGWMHWWAGAIMGLVHALFVLAVAAKVLPGIHPRMATETRGPDPTHQLEPPGFLALNYGRSTPVVTILAHVVYGAILGFFYTKAL